MKKAIPYALVISMILNAIFIFLLYTDMASERESKELIISEFVENQKMISANFNQLSLELSTSGNETISVDDNLYNEILYTLKETDKLLQLNEELYLDNTYKGVLSPSMRALNMEGLGLMPILWNELLNGDITKELPNIKEYNILLRKFLNELNHQHYFQNVDNPKEMARILEDVSSELVPQN